MPRVGSTTSRELTAVGAYIFAGGFTVGVKRAGFKVLCHLEESNYGVATAKKNFPDLDVYYPPETWPVAELAKSEVDFVYGNPPCAAWSGAGSAHHHGGSWRESPLVDCTRRHFSLLEKLRPRVWVWESVQRAWTAGREFVLDLSRKAAGMGYSTTVWLHDAQYLNTPQKRQRFFMICHDVDLTIREPDWESETVDEALSRVVNPGLPVDNNIRRVADMLDQMRAGESLCGLWTRLTPPEEVEMNERGQVKGRPSFAITRARSGRPAPVVRHEMVHPTEPRGLSVKELQVLCGYPESYEFVGSGIPHQIGRGVCPPVAKSLGDHVRESLTTMRKVRSPGLTVVDFTKPPGNMTAFTFDQLSSGDVDVPKIRPASPRRPDPSQTDVPDVSKLEGEGSGAYIRRLLATDSYTDEQIVSAVHRQFAGRKTGVNDVRWNRAKMSKETTTEVQPKSSKRVVDETRTFDTTALHERAHGEYVHRDYAAHFFRWGFAGRFVDATTEVLDVGCGVDCPLMKVLSHPRSNVPKRYVGVDYNSAPRKVPSRQWGTTYFDFNFLERYADLGQFDLVTNFEVIEHMRKKDGDRLLSAMRKCLKPTGRLLLSTPVFNGKAAANHIHEWTIPELSESIAAAGLTVVQRYGTFASFNDLKKVASPAELAIMRKLSEYYSGEVISCFLAPLHPDASRNNVWVLRKS